MQIETENLYDVFAKYPLKQIDACPCGCNPEDKIHNLQTIPLNNLSAVDLGHYCGSAIWTWGDEEDFKHFLPRIFEILFELKEECDISTILGKLEVAKWNSWEYDEKIIVSVFLRKWWIEATKENLNDSSEIFAAIINYISTPLELLDEWTKINNERSFRNLVEFIYEESNRILIEEKIWFSKIENRGFPMAYRNWLYSSKLMELLENAFFQFEKSDKELAEKISICIDIIDLNKKIKAGNKR